MIRENYFDGLIAEWYDDWLKPRKDDVTFYSDYFKGFKGKVLELACGTGRLVLPIAKSGITIHGLDSSVDMLKRLRDKTQENSLNNINTFQQSMAGFSLPEKYDAIFVGIGSFQLLTSDKDVTSCLQAIERHLNEKGFLLLDVFVPWDAIKAGKSDGFIVTRDNKRKNGSRCLVMERFEIDYARQLQISVFKYEIYLDNLLTKSIIGDFELRWYWKDQMLNLLRENGFMKVELLTNNLYQENRWFVFRAE